MPSRGSGLEQAVVRTTLSPMRITTDPCACLASFPVSILMDLPPASWTVVSCFMVSSFLFGERQCRQECGRLADGTMLFGWLNQAFPLVLGTFTARAREMVKTAQREKE